MNVVGVKPKFVNMMQAWSKEKEQVSNGMLHLQTLIGTGQDQQLQPRLITEIKCQIK